MLTPVRTWNEFSLILCVYVTTDAMFSFDIYIDVDANADVKCEQSITVYKQ